jgi:hypothetical protein
MRTVGVLLVFGFVIAFSAPAGAELVVGLSGGVVIPGDQDLTFKEHSASGSLLNSVSTSDVDETFGPIVGAAVTVWGDQGVLRYFALQGEALYWYMEAKPAPIPPAPRFTVGQHRTAIFLSALGRLPVYPSLGRFSSEKSGSDTFAYLGVGAGPVYTSVQHGQKEWDAGFQLLGGVAIPLMSRLQLRVESRYLLASDADSSPEPGWRVDTSGTSGAFRLGRHRDTRFIPVLFGLDWRF